MDSACSMNGSFRRAYTEHEGIPMSDNNNPQPTPQPMTVIPVHYPPPRSGGVRRFLVGVLLIVSLFFNFILLSQVSGCGTATSALNERFHSGSRLATDKIAIVQIDGMLMEGMMGFARKQIEQAAADRHVKAVIVRIN